MTMRFYSNLSITVLTSLLFFSPCEGQLFKKLKEKQEQKRQAELPSQAKLQPGQFEWHPERAPSGPLLIVVSIDDQIAYVYRNGIQVGRSTCSTGRPGKETPTGVFSVLQKRKDHESSIYKGAKMPNMQRLTWTGIAIHAGDLPGYPASAGCVRLPLAFSEILFGQTSLGATVVITQRNRAPSKSEKPASILLASQVESSSIPIPERRAFWNPRKSPKGPVALLLSTGDQSLYVYRNGILIGQIPVGFVGGKETIPSGVFLMLEGSVTGTNPIVPSREMRPWSVLSLESKAPGGVYPITNLRQRLRVDPKFAKLVYDIMNPGALMVVTHQQSKPENRADPGFVIMNQRR